MNRPAVQSSWPYKGTSDKHDSTPAVTLLSLEARKLERREAWGVVWGLLRIKILAKLKMNDTHNNPAPFIEAILSNALSTKAQSVIE
jgi:hypothetical protein